MKRLIFWAGLGLCTALVSCSTEEDALTPSGNYSVLRMKFPQGDNDFDQEIKAIHDQYGVYLLYKEITEEDLNRTWVSQGTGLIYRGLDLPDSDVPFYVDFFKQQIFPNLTPEMTRSGFPVKIYMMKNSPKTLIRMMNPKMKKNLKILLRQTVLA